MNERNDLIERLRASCKWAFQVRSDCNVSAVGARGHGPKFYSFSDECDQTANDAYRAFCTMEDAADTIAAQAATIARLEAEVEALRDPWSSDMEAKPRGADVVVYQPAFTRGRTRLPARITTESNAGYVRETTHWMVPAPPRAEGERG